MKKISTKDYFDYVKQKKEMQDMKINFDFGIVVALIFGLLNWILFVFTDKILFCAAGIIAIFTIMIFCVCKSLR